MPEFQFKVTVIEKYEKYFTVDADHLDDAERIVLDDIGACPIESSSTLVRNDVSVDWINNPQ